MFFIFLKNISNMLGQTADLLSPSFRGQLKMVVCGTEQKLTVTVLGLRELSYCQTTPDHSSFVYVKMSVCPDDDLRLRHKTTPQLITGESMTLHETFEFDICRCSHDKRLLLSAWKKAGPDYSSEFIGCMSFGIRNIAYNQEVIQGWFFLLRETLGRRKHLKVRSVRATAGDGGHRRPVLHGENENLSTYKTLPNMAKKRECRPISVWSNTISTTHCEVYFGCCPCKRCRPVKGERLTKDYLPCRKATVDKRHHDSFNCNRSKRFRENEMQDVCDDIHDSGKGGGGEGLEQFEKYVRHDSGVLLSAPQRQRSHRKMFLRFRGRTADTVQHRSISEVFNLPDNNQLLKDDGKDCNTGAAKREQKSEMKRAHWAGAETASVSAVTSTALIQPEQATNNKAEIEASSVPRIVVCTEANNQHKNRCSPVSSQHSDSSSCEKDAMFCKNDSNSDLKTIDVSSDRLSGGVNLINRRARSQTSKTRDRHSVHLKPRASLQKSTAPNLFVKETATCAEDEASVNKQFKAKNLIHGKTTENQEPSRSQTLSSAESSSLGRNILRRSGRFKAKYSIHGKTTENQEPSRSQTLSSAESSSLGRNILRRSGRNSCKGCYGSVANLSDLLEQKDGEDAFRKLLQSEFSEENLDFWLECKSFKQVKKKKLAKAALKIYDCYLDDASPRQINIDFQTRQEVKAKLSKPSLDMFDRAQKSIFELMKLGPFRRFLASDFVHKCKARDIRS